MKKLKNMKFENIKIVKLKISTFYLKIRKLELIIENKI